MKKILSLFVIISSLSISLNSFAHSGGTNSEGCHTNHNNGDYHCHNPKP